MQIKRLFLICFAILLSLQTNCYAKAQKQKEKSKAQEFASIVWPIFFGGGNFFFSQSGVDGHFPGYTFSGGLTFYTKEKDVIDTIDVFFFMDALYSHRAYEGLPQKLHYKIEENSADVAIGIGFNNIYAGGYLQIPVNTKIAVDEWTIEDFDGLSRDPSFSFMCGLRIAGKHLGVDLRVLLGQGPGQFLKKDFGDHYLGQVSLGFMARL